MKNLIFVIFILMGVSLPSQSKLNIVDNDLKQGQSETSTLITTGDYISVDDRIRIHLLGVPFKGPLELCQILIAIFLSILFIQSGCDKIIFRGENIKFFKNHFSGTIFSRFFRISLTFLTITELTAGFVLVYGIFYSFYFFSTEWIFNGLVISSLNMIFLFFGQRIAKDYIGAVNLVPYFILIMLGIMSMY